MLSLVRKLKKNSGALAVDAASSSEKRVLEEGADDNPLVSAEEFVRFVGGEYEAAEAAQGRLRKVLTLAEEKDGVTLEAAFGALDKVSCGWVRNTRASIGVLNLLLAKIFMSDPIPQPTVNQTNEILPNTPNQGSTTSIK